MRLFNSGAAAALMNRGNVPEDVAIESGIVSKAIASAQSQVEGRNAEIRKNVLKYDDVLNRQREAIYTDRRHILAGDDLTGRVDTFLEDVITAVVDGQIFENSGTDWDLDSLWKELKTIYPVGITVDEVLTEAGTRSKLTKAWLTREILADARIAYSKRAETVGEAPMHELERRVVLSVLDRKWRDHLYEMDYLKEGIGLRAMAQRDPLVEYQREGFNMFTQMMGSIKEESIGFLFNLDVQVEGAVQEAPPAQANLTFSAPSESGNTEVKETKPQRPDNGEGSSFFKK
jgi:preprotein translocase subunit SecA